jgi:hypothetical protein
MMFAAVIWLFTAGQAATDREQRSVRWLTRYTALGVGGYPITFVLFYPGGSLGSPAALAVFGTLALAGIIWQLLWTLRQSHAVTLSVARLAALGAMINLTIGSILGVLIELRFAGLNLPTGNVFAAHPAMLTVGYILAAAVALIEWRLVSGIDGRRDRLGVVVVGLLVVAGWLAALGLAAGMVELLMVMTICQIVAVVLFTIRVAPRLVRVAWLTVSDERLVALAFVALIVDVALTVALLAAVIPDDAPPPPPGLLIALAHTEFVGLMTNAFFAMLGLATAARRAAVWPWADHVLFWGLNIGWIGFVAAEYTQTMGLVRVFTPILGISLLIGIVAFGLRLWPAGTPTPSRSAPVAAGND